MDRFQLNVFAFDRVLEMEYASAGDMKDSERKLSAGGDGIHTSKRVQRQVGWCSSYLIRVSSGIYF